MPKKTKRVASGGDNKEEKVQQHSHEFTSKEEQSIRAKLLEWYDDNKRDLPWRRYATELDRNKRGYAVWVSEIMLQQTQVATVIDYYNRWMQKWPTMQDLAKASLEEVNECWSGLGYYSRARRLYEGCNKVCKDLNGNVPTSASDLQKHLPGVGRYTAGAIASIAFNEATGVVDGNVIRVLSRLRVIGADSTSNTAIDKFWQLANSLVDDGRPGDFNQAMMELGATVCTPKIPQCRNCPLSKHCMALKQVEDFRKNKETEFLTALNNNCSKANATDSDIESCDLCLPTNIAWDSALGVGNYPIKPRKKEIKEQTYQACLVKKNCTSEEAQFLIVQRPETGLLAGMWEFPNIEIDPDMPESKVKSMVLEFLSEKLGLSELKNKKEVGEIAHKFSHRHHTYKVVSFICDDMDSRKQTVPTGQAIKWMSKEDLQDAAMPTAMRKILKLYEDSVNKVAPAAKKRKLNDPKGNQKTIDSFFKPKAK